MCGWDTVAPVSGTVENWTNCDCLFLLREEGGSVGDLPQVYSGGIPACSASLAVCLNIV